MTATAVMPAPASTDSLFVATHQGVPHWVARWRDDVDRPTRRYLAPKSELTEAQARKLAAAEFLKHQERYFIDIERRSKFTAADLLDLSQVANFPRVPVAHYVSLICNRFKIEEDSPGTGIQRFAERASISKREAQRITEDEEKVWVSLSIVDRICIEFDYLLDEFTAASFDWAEKKGIWAGRPGGCDPWPIGYRSPPKPDNDII